jgi:2-dehydro-3-deoxygalactonokinase
MKKFLSCDWGTSTFRLRLIDMESARVLFSENSAEGIGQIHQAWKNSGGESEERLAFYEKIIARHIRKMESNSGQSLELIPLVISGMASSSIGMTELPYAKLPLPLDGSVLETTYLPATKTFLHDTLIVSGASTHDDVMRGEETMLIGCAEEGFFNEHATIIFPGTHSKHVDVKENHAVALKTYMTGEFFDLLSRLSILSVAVNKNEWVGEGARKEAFQDGVKCGAQTNLLHGAFKVRTNSLLNQLGPEENYHYLSGLLIGNELGDLMNKSLSSLVLISDALMGLLYEDALDVLGIKPSLHSFRKADATDALIKGHLAIYRNLAK